MGKSTEIKTSFRTQMNKKHILIKYVTQIKMTMKLKI